MAISKSRHFSKKKASGGIYRTHRKKRLFELASPPTLTKIGKRKMKKSRIRAGKIKTRLLAIDIANIYNSKIKKYQKTKIISVLENPANRHYIRKNIITKGTIIETELGKAKVSSRPGQEGTINAILIS